MCMLMGFDFRFHTNKFANRWFRTDQFKNKIVRLCANLDGERLLNLSNIDYYSTII